VPGQKPGRQLLVGLTTIPIRACLAGVRESCRVSHRCQDR